jgi:hypothetical protein
VDEPTVRIGDPHAQDVRGARLLLGQHLVERGRVPATTVRTTLS